MVLDEAGIRADVCMSGEEALRMLEVQNLKQEPYNLVLLDRNMPGMNGVETAKEIRAHYDNEITVIILTAYNWDDVVEKATAAGVDGFLAKPLFASNVIAEFERVARHNNINLFQEKQKAELAGRRVLLAEDMEINAEIMMDILEMEGIVADHAENGKIAVEMFESSPVGTYAAILMDVRMPEMDGLEAATAIGCAALPPGGHERPPHQARGARPPLPDPGRAHLGAGEREVNFLLAICGKVYIILKRRFDRRFNVFNTIFYTRSRAVKGRFP